MPVGAVLQRWRAALSDPVREAARPLPPRPESANGVAFPFATGERNLHL